MEMAVRVEKLNKFYGDFQALKDFNLEIAEGEIFGLLGPNGAGKSTLIGILTGIVMKSSGNVEVFLFRNFMEIYMIF